jgi:dTDP-4-dehydrorhamnose reductase
MDIKKSKAFVVGASGYIGSQLLDKSSNFFSSFGTTSSLNSMGLLHLKLNNPLDFDYEIISSDDTIFLTAAISSPDTCEHKSEYAWSVNVSGTIKFISKVIERGARVIFFSSDTVYGERQCIFNETTSINPSGGYAQMKAEVENQFKDELLFKAIRLSYVFSRDDKFTKYLMGCHQQGVVAEIFHPFYRSIIHRDDVVDGAISLARFWGDYPQRIINFGGPEVLSRVDFAQQIKDGALTNLLYEVIEPAPEFFKNRPRTIAMSSDYLPLLLDRPPHTLTDAVRVEFNEQSFKTKLDA